MGWNELKPTGNDKIVLLLSVIYVTRLRIIKFRYWGLVGGGGEGANIPQQMILI
jgi:hypothetical protein